MRDLDAGDLSSAWTAYQCGVSLDEIAEHFGCTAEELQAALDVSNLSANFLAIDADDTMDFKREES
jgi:hypothetical protein